jgi:hypothetical protein
MKRIASFAVSMLGAAVWAQASPPEVFPVPISGGDVIPPTIAAYAPGDPAIGFDGRDIEPYVIENIKGEVAMGYTTGHATDSAGAGYQVVTDLRVFQGDYVGATSSFVPTRAHGTFVLI